MLMQIDRIQRRNQRRNILWVAGAEPVPWCELDYGVIKHRKPVLAWGSPGVTHDELMADAKRQGWNIEQSTRRSLRSLEQRGLVELRRGSFRPYAIETRRNFAGHKVLKDGSFVYWHHSPSSTHVTGQDHLMTGVTLTGAGRNIVRKLRMNLPGAKERREEQRQKRKDRARRNAIMKADSEWVMAECKLLNAGRTAEADELGAARHKAHRNGTVVEEWQERLRTG
jgi:hypothetical protein